MRTFLSIGYFLAITLLLSQCNGNSYLFNSGMDGEGPTTERTLKLDNFTGVHLSIAGDVYLSQGEQRVSISAQENIIDNILTEVNDGVWKIKMDEPADDYKEVKIHISIPNLTDALISGSGNIIGETAFTNLDDLVVKISGSGGINLNVEADDIEGRISGSGDIQLAGKADDFDMTISGSGDIRAFDLIAETCDISVSGSGDCEVHANEKLDVKVSGSGDVHYKGRPAIHSRISGSGDLHASN